MGHIDPPTFPGRVLALVKVLGYQLVLYQKALPWFNQKLSKDDQVRAVPEDT
jgi:hypothetical protein